MKPPPVPCRIDGIVAREANQAVIFRRGPSRFVQQLIWDFNDDSVTSGQWLKGAVYTRRCDVSPDGRYLVLFASNYSNAYRPDRNQHVKDPWLSVAWTAISRPPYFTALALWFTGSAWNGGGMWAGNHVLEVNPGPGAWSQHLAPDRRVKVRRLKLGLSEDEPLFTMRLQRHGWEVRRELVTTLLNPDWRAKALGLTHKLLTSSDIDEQLQAVQGLGDEAMPRYRTDVTGLMEKPFARGILTRETYAEGETWGVRDDSGKIHRKWSQAQRQWLDVDARGRVVFADQGCLWAWADFPDGEPKLIANLHDNVFEAVPPPVWAREW